MSITPQTMARQMTVARQQRTERARLAHVAPNIRLAFTSETGVQRPKPPAETVEIFDDYCFVCSRCTDHLGEHDDIDDVKYEQDTERYFDEERNIWFVTHTSRVMRENDWFTVVRD